jgi:hypothetical protein
LVDVSISRERSQVSAMLAGSRLSQSDWIKPPELRNG